MKETLDDCLRECAEAVGLVLTGRAAMVHRCSPQDAIRDASVIWAMGESFRGGGEAVSPEALLEGRGSDSLWRQQPGARARFNGVGSRRSMGGGSDVRCGCRMDVVRAMQAGGGLERPMGYDQSWSRVGEAPLGGVRLDMRGMARILAVKGGTLRCEAGCSIREVTVSLAARGLCLASLPVLQDQTVGGAAGTGSHGSSLRYGTVSDLVARMVVVSPGGGERVFEGGGDAARAARLGMGRLGTCVECELEVVEGYEVSREVRVVQVGRLAEEAREGGMLREAEHAWCFVRMGGDEAVAVLLRRCARSGSGGGDDSASEVGDAQAQENEGGQQATGVAGYDALGAGPFVDVGPPRRYDGQNWFPHPLPAMPVGSAEEGGGRGAWLSMQYALPLSRMDEGLGVLSALGRDRGGGMRGRLVELKFLAASRRTLMGPNTSRASGGRRSEGGNDGPEGEGGCEAVCFNLWWREDAASAVVGGGISGMMGAFEREMQGLGAVPHWGKLHAVEEGYIGSVLEGAPEFFRQVGRP